MHQILAFVVVALILVNLREESCDYEDALFGERDIGNSRTRSLLVDSS